MGMEPPILDRAESSWAHGGNRRQEDAPPAPTHTHTHSLHRHRGSPVQTWQTVKQWKMCLPRNTSAPLWPLMYCCAYFLCSIQLCIIYTVAAVRRRNCAFNHKWIPMDFNLRPHLPAGTAHFCFLSIIITYKSFSILIYIPDSCWNTNFFKLKFKTWRKSIYCIW